MVKKQEIKYEAARRLRAAREAVNPNLSELTRELGWNYNTYKAHEAGARRFNQEDAAKYAKAFNVSVNHLLVVDLISGKQSPEIPRPNEIGTFAIPVYGQAAGGVWLEGEDMPFDDEPIIVAPVAGYPVKYQYARKVVGNSISNRVKDGEYVIFVKYEYYGGKIEDGKLVDCRRLRSGLSEHSVKVYSDNKLMTDSAEMKEQLIIPMHHSDDDTVVSIEGVAVGKFSYL